MILILVFIFVLGYACIAMEQKLQIEKAATALMMFGLMWSAYAIGSGNGQVGTELLGHLGSTCETLIFLIGAMTIVDLIDTAGWLHHSICCFSVCYQLSYVLHQEKRL